MSKISIKGATTGTGVFTLESPATNTDRTLVLPDEAGTVLTSAGVPASAMPAGSVLQVVYASTTTEVSTTATYADIGLGATITPSSASNKILVLSSIGSYSGAANPEAYLALVRDSSTTLVEQGYACYSPYPIMSRTPVQYLDSPNTTSPVNYKFRGKNANGNVVYWNYDDSGGDQTSTLILMEIAA